MSAKEAYRKFCEEHEYVPLFHQAFWWDAVSTNWAVEKITIDNTTAFVPYSIEKKLGFTISRNPLLTPYSGPIYLGDYSSNEKQLLSTKMLDFLQQYSLSEYDCNPQLSKGLVSETTKTTYLLPLDNSLEEIHSNFKSSLIRQIKKAEQQLTIEEDIKTSRFFEIYSDSIGRQNKANKTPKDLIEKVFAVCRDNKCGHIFTAVDKDSNAHSAIWYVEDDRCAYYLLGGSRKEFLGSGAMGFLLWNCIKLAHSRGKQLFDFEGSEVPGVAKFFSTFGGTQHSYPVLKGRTNAVLATLLKIKNSFG